MPTKKKVFMRVLQLCKKFPFPLKDGEAIAVVNLSRSLRDAGASLTLLAMNTSKHPTDLTQLPPDFTQTFEEIHAVYVNNFITIGGALRNLLFEKTAYHVSRFISPDFEQKLVEILGGGLFDVILLETVFLAPYISTIRQVSPRSKIMLRSHNVEHEVWERVANTMQNPLKAQYLRFMNRRLQRFELSALADFDGIVAITERDAEAFRGFGYTGRQVVAPVGLDCKDYDFDAQRFEDLVNKCSISFIGSLDWMPNQEGIRWFLREVWQPFFLKKPILLEVAGINPPDWLRRTDLKNVQILGEVADAKIFLRQHAIMIAPLFSGGGIRVKILEGMMLGRVVITTSTGLEGIAATDGVEVLIANDAESFKEKIEFCYKNPQKMVEISQNARKWVIENFDRNHIAKRVITLFEA